jgi:hypothetical protein
MGWWGDGKHDKTNMIRQHMFRLCWHGAQQLPSVTGMVRACCGVAALPCC